MYKARIMAATSYLPKASPYIVFNNRFFTLGQYAVISHCKEVLIYRGCKNVSGKCHAISTFVQKKKHYEKDT